MQGGFRSRIGAGTLPDIAFWLFRGLIPESDESRPRRETACADRDRSARDRKR